MSMFIEESFREVSSKSRKVPVLPISLLSLFHIILPTDEISFFVCSDQGHTNSPCRNIAIGSSSFSVGLCFLTCEVVVVEVFQRSIGLLIKM